MDITPRRLTDPDALKALAHPTRMALLGALATEGPLTASQAADLVGESPSNCSWHLRKLAAHGLVREAAGGTGRNRPWEAAQPGLQWDEGEDADPAARVAADALTDAFLDREMQRLRAGRAHEADLPPEWREVTDVHQSGLWLTADEAQELVAGIRELMFRHLDRHQHPERRPEGARLVSVVSWLVPISSHRADLSSDTTTQNGDQS